MYAPITKNINIAPMFWLAKDTYCIDILHSWHLGPLAEYIAFVLWFLICYVFCPETVYLEKESEYRVALLRCKQQIWSYYREKRSLDADWRRTGSQVRLCKVKETCSNLFCWKWSEPTFKVVTFYSSLLNAICEIGLQDINYLYILWHSRRSIIIWLRSRISNSRVF